MTKNKSIFLFLWILACSALALLQGCDRFLDIDPPSSKMGRQTAFLSDNTAEAALRGVYQQMFEGFASGHSGSVTINAAISADELVFVNHQSGISPYEEIGANNISWQNEEIKRLWSNFYAVIYACNGVLEGVQAANGVLSKPTVDRILGEAHFLRAFTYFYLCNLFGEVPMALTTDYRKNAQLSLSSVPDVYAQVGRDLEIAHGLLGETYSGMYRSAPNRSTVVALMARLALFSEKWQEAENYATAVIDRADLYKLISDLDEVFLTGSKEAIWQRLPGTVNGMTAEANLFFVYTPHTYIMTDRLLQRLTSQADARSGHWVFRKDTEMYAPYKYKSTSNTEGKELSVIFRLAEQYLIRAEARARQGNIDGAISDVDAIRGRAGLPLIVEVKPDISGKALLDSILVERQRELYSEWGHRWLDLKRTGQAVEELASVKPGFTETDEWYPIPESEILSNPRLESDSE